MNVKNDAKSKQSQGKQFWRFRAEAGGKSADLLLYGPISNTTWWGDEVTPKQFAEDLAALGDIETLNVYINSEGGDGWAAQAIYSQLKRFRAKAKVNVYIDGIAASAASLVAMAGETVYMPRNAMMMVHRAWMIAMGDVDDLRKAADMLEQFYDTMVAVYREKTGLSEKEIRKIMDAETWMTAEEAVELGFADEIEETRSVAASLRDDGSILAIGGREIIEFDVNRFKRFPRERVFGDVATAPAASMADGAAGGAGGANGAARASEASGTREAGGASGDKGKPSGAGSEKPISDKSEASTKDKRERSVTELELTVEILAEKYPDIHAAVKKLGQDEGHKAGYNEGFKAGRDEGVKAERARMKAIDELALPGAEAIIAKAKYETGADAATVAVEIVKAEKAKGATFLAAAQADAKPLGDIKPDSAPDASEQVKVELEAAKAAFARGANRKRGGDK